LSACVLSRQHYLLHVLPHVFLGIWCTDNLVFQDNHQLSISHFHVHILQQQHTLASGVLLQLVQLVQLH
jgi:hypothetical protein